ncbi:hypothetical protein [Glycomyces terrestris]|uniref:DUF998 domain-containing protein n=1 Tax=Glycomyces terrestris TaxID=2493553 RepID=A0A426V3E3_9ACTN|nr:hypothetical protein [Glycomyces terrestris]RRS01360.1 hypothetical protein EIW28_00865 [Glycomyces terrestris]
MAVSVVHYIDNYANYDDYPVPHAHSRFPVPSATVVGVSWFVFTAFGAAAVLLWRRRAIAWSAAALGVYSLSGLVGIVHYLMPGATDMAWWRQTHVILDIACGLALLAFAVWAGVRHGELGETRR